MSEDSAQSYQIVATGPGLPAGKEIRAAVGSEQFLIGSGENAHLKLTGKVDMLGVSF